MNKTKNRKGVFDLGMSAILTIVILLVLIFFLRDTIFAASKNVEDKDCQASIEAHIQTLKVSGERETSDINCPTKYKNITGKDETAIKYELAEEMRKAWKLWKEGKENVFAGEEGIFCHIYSVLEFKKKNMKIEGFDEYLLVSEIPNGGMTYQEYMAPYVTEDTGGIEIAVEKLGTEMQTKNIEKPIIDTNQQYMVLFRIAKGKDKIMIFTSVQKETAAGVTMGILRGALVGGGTGVVVGQVCSFFPFVGNAVCGVVGGVVGFVAGAVVGTITYFTFDGSDPQDYAASISLLPYTEEVLRGTTCEYVPIGGSEILIG